MEKHRFWRRAARPIGLALLALGTQNAAAAEPAADCVGFEKEEGEKQLAFHATNACDKRLECRLSYALRCEDNDGKITSTATPRLAFQLTPKGELALKLSAASCKQGWRIDDVAWSCF